MGHMARLYFSKAGVMLFYGTLVVYLYGDLAIYITVVSKSLRDVVCTANTTLPTCAPLFSENLSRNGAYRLFCILFLLTVGPFTFLTISKTKYLQITTTLFRWTAFILMILLAILKISNEEGLRPEMVNFKQLPSLFGVAIYSFMVRNTV